MDFFPLNGSAYLDKQEFEYNHNVLQYLNYCPKASNDKLLLISVK